jgi:hypothetical protein
MKTVWTKRRISQFVVMRKAGFGNEEIAAALGLSKGAVASQAAILIRSGVISSRRGLPRSHPDACVDGTLRTLESTVIAVARLYAADKTHREIAAATSFTQTQVHALLHGLFAAGLPKRGIRTRGARAGLSAPGSRARERTNDDGISARMASAVTTSGTP